MKTRTLISLEPSQFFSLKHLAATKKISMSALIRQAVDLILEQKTINPGDLILKSAQEVKKTYPKNFKFDKNLSKKIDQIVYG
jgi:hypothetical protein